MDEPMRSRREAASVIFNLPDYQVLDAIDLPSGSRRVIVRVDTITDSYPVCGVVSARVHAWCRQRVKDLPHAGDVELVVVKPRLVCRASLYAQDVHPEHARTVVPGTVYEPTAASHIEGGD